MERLTIQYMDGYWPKALCTICRDGEADDAESCEECCQNRDGNCDDCPLDRCIDRLAVYENAHEQIEKRIKWLKEREEYPHNFMGQMVEDLEWVLQLFD